MFDIKNKKLGAAIVSLVVALSVVICSVCIYGTGLISDINPEADEARITIEIDGIKKETIEGTFVDRSGEAITTSVEPGEAAIVNYPESFSPIIGYNSERMGTSHLRHELRSYLYDGGKDGVGATVQLTINASMQEKLYKLLDGHVGSISIINAETGEILAMVSRGDPKIGFDVNKIDDIYKQGETPEDVKYYSDLYNEVKEFYYNRATLAQDPPGSTAKVMTAVSLVENGKEDMVYYDETGYYLGKTIHNYKYVAYGECDLKMALNQSINTYFANAGVELGGAKLKKTYKNFMVGESIELDFTTLNSTFIVDNQYSDFLIASNAYGQGELVMSPLHVAMMMGSIMNKGEMMKPYLIENITDDNKTVYKKNVETLSKVTDKDTCKKVKELLITNAEYYGFYDSFDKDDVTIIAKSGTADVADETKGNHIYYSVGVEFNGTPYGICIDRVNVPGASGELKSTVVDVIDILMSETAE